MATKKSTAKKKPIQYADDDKYPVTSLIGLRLPSLLVGLSLGIIITFATSRFEEVLTKNIQIAFFIPYVIYMADAVGTQTQNIYVRELKTGKARFKSYLAKELAVGLIFGVLFGAVSAIVVTFWFGSVKLAASVGLAMLVAIFTAPLVALLVSEVLQIERSDPAVGAGPIATVIQDTISVIIYGVIATHIMLN